MSDISAAAASPAAAPVEGGTIDERLTEVAPADEPAATNEPTAEPPVEDVGNLIEDLNSAIDQVNVLEDEYQACCAQHGAALRALQAMAAALEAELLLLPGALQIQVAAVLDAAIAAARARRACTQPQEAVAWLQQEQSRLNIELNVADFGERLSLTTRCAALRNSIAAATRTLNSLKKAAANATSREDKARKQLQRVYAQEAAMVALDPLPPLWDENSLLDRRVRLALEVEGANAARAAELAEKESQKEAAAAKVSEAMQALEEMSEKIHQSRQAEGGELSAQGDDASEDSVESNRPMGDSASDAAATSLPHTPRSSAPGSRGDEARDTPTGIGTPFSRGSWPSTTPSSVRRTKSAEEGEGAYLATRKTVARLLKKAGELLAPQPAHDAWAQPIIVHYVDTHVGIAWMDQMSIARLQAECSTVVTQEI